MSQMLGYLDCYVENKEYHGSVEIVERCEILMGRDANSCQLVLTNSTISNRHIRIYSIIYDSTVEPFVYAEDLSRNGCQWFFKEQKAWKCYPMSNGSSFLLSNGDKIQLCDGSFFIFRSVPFCQKLQASADPLALRTSEIKSFASYFTITDRLLGSGGTGKVLMALDHSKQCQRACKVINLNKFPKNSPSRTRLWQEVKILEKLCHPNIIKIEKVFYTDNTIYIIEDLITGGDLTSYLERKGGSLENEDACFIVYQITKALEHLHKHNVVHRDVKPENVLMSSIDTGARVILTDFGQATKITVQESRTRRMQTLCGTLDWVAPEVNGRNKIVADAGYTKSVDMWSLGCLTTALLNGKSIFVNTQDSNYRRDSIAAVTTAAAMCDLSLLDHDLAWEDVEPHAKDFIKRLLELNEVSRMTAEQALGHAWFIEGGRKAVLQEQYHNTTKNWVRTTCPLDFIENLDSWMYWQAKSPPSADRKKLSACQMPPPKRPELICSTQKGTEPFQNRSENESISVIRKRRSSTYVSVDETAIYDEAGKENRVFISAKEFGEKVVKKRLLIQGTRI